MKPEKLPTFSKSILVYFSNCDRSLSNSKSDRPSDSVWKI